MELGVNDAEYQKHQNRNDCDRYQPICSHPGLIVSKTVLIL